MPNRVSPAAMMARGALMVYLRPRLAMDSRQHCMNMVDRAVGGLTSANFRQSQSKIINSLRRATQGRLAQDNGISDLAALLGALSPQVEQADQAPGMGQIASAPGGSAGPMGVSPMPDAEPQDTVANIKAYLEQEGVAPEIINNLDAFLAQHQPTNGGPPNGGGGGPPNGGGGGGGGAGDKVMPPQPGQDQESIEGSPGDPGWHDMEPRGGDTSEFRPESASDAAEDDGTDPSTDPWETAGDDNITPETQSEQFSGVPSVSSEGKSSRYVGGQGGGQDARPVTRSALDHAIKVAQDSASKNQRAIREAERFVRPWVGDIAMDAAGPADVYRGALKALGVRGADKLHPDALKPILEVQPRPGIRAAHDRRQMAQDSNVKPEGSFLDRFPDAAKVTIQ